MPEFTLTRLRGGWAVAWYEGSGPARRRHRNSLGTDDRKTAQALLEAFKRQHEKPPEITIQYLWEEYRKEKSEKRIALNMDFSGRAILPNLGHLTPADMTVKQCRTYVATRRKTFTKRGPIQSGTIWTELNHLQIVLTWAKKRNLISEKIAIERPSKPPPKDRRLTRVEGKRLIEAAREDHIKLAIALMLGTGARSGAILDLTWDRVDFERGLIFFADPTDLSLRKGRATVRMNQDLKARMLVASKLASSRAATVIEWADKPVKSIKKGFASAVKAAGLENVSPHVLRHSAASWMAEAGVSMDRIAQFLGHSDPATTFKIYARFSPEYQQDAANALDLSGVLLGTDEPEIPSEE